MIKRYLQIGVIGVVVLLLVAAFMTTKSSSRDQQNTPLSAKSTQNTQPAPSEQIANDAPPRIANPAKAVLDVQGMSCSGCIYEIKSSLAGLEGIGDVLVDLSTGRVQVYYDEKKLTDVGRIASAITAVGYPATLRQMLTPDEIEKESSFMASRSKLYIAAVGDWEISRDDYDIELAHARSRYEKLYGTDVFGGDQGSALMQRLQSQVVSRLINEGIQMQEIGKAGFKLSPETVTLEFKQFLSQKGMTPDEFRVALQDTGYEYSYFLKKFENQLTINRYVEENVLSAISNDLEKRQQYSDWYNNARLLAKVVYYDRNLEAIVNNGSNTTGCGSSCTRK